jgi:hypothetical protein
MARLAAASVSIQQAPPPAQLDPAAVAPAEAGEKLVPTPVLGLMVSQALLQNGQGAGALPGPLAELVAALAPQVQPPERREAVRVLYRLFRAWVLIYYSPEEMLALGVQL